MAPSGQIHGRERVGQEASLLSLVDYEKGNTTQHSHKRLAPLKSDTVLVKCTDSPQKSPKVKDNFHHKGDISPTRLSQRMKERKRKQENVHLACLTVPTSIKCTYQVMVIIFLLMLA